jgi:hypothetical protein
MDMGKTSKSHSTGLSWLTQIFKILAGPLVVIGLLPAVPANAAVDSSPTSKVDDIRKRLLVADGKADAGKQDDGAGSTGPIAQWFNFPNFPNFPNWGNWFRNY